MSVDSLADAFYDMGNVYHHTPVFNGSQLFWVMLHRDNKPEKLIAPTIEGTTNAQAAIDAAMVNLPSELESADDRLSAEELKNTAEMLRHACRRGRWLIDPSNEDSRSLHQHLSDTIDEHRRLWLKRNRAGGLADSSGRLQKTLTTYQ